MKKRTNRCISALLVIVMIISMFPVSAFATDDVNGSTAPETTVQAIQINERNEIVSLTAVRLAKGPEGRLAPVPGTERTVPCGLLLIAAGFVGCEEATLARFALQPDARGRLMPSDGSHHLGGKLFSAGDMRTGQSLVVRALADGRAAALEAHRFLCGKNGF